MSYKDAKAEDIINKTISEARITDDNVEIKFTDGTEMDIRLTYVGYAGARLDSTYWPN